MNSTIHAQATAPIASPSGFERLPSAALQKIVNALSPHDALHVGRVSRAGRQASALHPLLRAPLAWADPALCVTPKIAARKLAEMQQSERDAYLRCPYFATRPDEHQLSKYGTQYPFHVQPQQELLQSHELTLQDRANLLVRLKNTVNARFADLLDERDKLRPRAFAALSKEDRASIIKAPPRVPYSTSTLARMGSLFIEAGARFPTVVRFFDGLIEERDSSLFAPTGGINEGAGYCAVGTLLRDIHTDDPMDHLFRVLNQNLFEQSPRLVRRVWHRIAGHPELIFRAMECHLDPMTTGCSPRDTLPDKLLELEFNRDTEDVPEGFWPPEMQLCWHVLMAFGLFLDTPLAGRVEADDQEQVSAAEEVETKDKKDKETVNQKKKKRTYPILTYRDMLFDHYNPLSRALMLDFIIKKTPLTYAWLHAEYEERVQFLATRVVQRLAETARAKDKRKKPAPLKIEARRARPEDDDLPSPVYDRFADQ